MRRHDGPWFRHCSKPSAKYSVQPPWMCRHQQAGAHGKRWGSRLKPGDWPHTLHLRRSWGSVDVNFSGTFFETCTPLPCSLCLFLMYKILPLQLLPRSSFGSGLSRLPCFCPSRWRRRRAGCKFPHNDASNILKTVIQLLSSLPFSAVNNRFFQTCFFL